jgi:hypothetical protein
VENLEQCPKCKKLVKHESYSACGNGYCEDCCNKCYTKNNGECEGK